MPLKVASAINLSERNKQNLTLQLLDKKITMHNYLCLRSKSEEKLLILKSKMQRKVIPQL